MRHLLPPALAAAALVFADAAVAGNTDMNSDTNSDTLLPAVTVTGTREQTLLSETPSAVGIIERDAIVQARPSHPQQLLGQVPGVAIGVTNGEGHTTAIRQGFTTSPLYLFLEDGIPVRATGNFNHNALYELNIPSAGGVEVVRGIGSALYGSDAVGGIVNVLTRTPRERAGADLTLEGGSFGFGRLLGGFDSGRLGGRRRDGRDDSDGHVAGGSSTLRGDLNLTHTDGWRAKTAYDRQSANLRWDYERDSSTVIKTIIGATHIDQQTGANSALPLDMYLATPVVNLRSPGYRIVDAWRVSSAIETDLGQGAQLSITPYFRDNRMDLNGTFNFSCNNANVCSGRIEKTTVQSLGLMLKYRKHLDDAMRTRVITGIDIDYSPSERKENSIALQSTGSGIRRNFTGYTVGARTYDYKVDYHSIAPYLHIETSPVEGLRLSAGLRYDHARYAFDNQLAAGTHAAGFYQLADGAVSFTRLSPKLGATWAFTGDMHAFASYNEGFRTPSENQLFRSGASNTAPVAAQAASALKPILANQIELGLRGHQAGWRYEAVAYQLTKHNDLLGQRDASNVVVQTNNGATRHRGVELGLGRQLASQWRLDVAASYAIHRYLDWSGNTSSGSPFNYSGKEIEASPRLLGNLRVSWTPAPGTAAQLEWVKLGAYYLDAGNQYGTYAGHDLFNLRMSQALDTRWTVFARVLNIADKRYADSASASAQGALYAPGLPRAAYVGLEGQW